MKRAIIKRKKMGKKSIMIKKKINKKKVVKKCIGKITMLLI